MNIFPSNEVYSQKANVQTIFNLYLNMFQIDLKMILTGVEDGSNRVIFTGRLCVHYDLKILINLDHPPDEKVGEMDAKWFSCRNAHQQPVCYRPQQRCEGYVFTGMCVSAGGGAWFRGGLVLGGGLLRGGGCLVPGGWYPNMH